MKKILFVICASFMIMGSVAGQNFSYGPVFGMNHTSFKIADFTTSEGTLYSYGSENGGIGIVAGGFLRYNYNNFFLQSHLLYSQEKTTILLTTPATECLQTFTINNLSMPVLFGYDIKEKCQVMAGPMFNSFLDGSVTPSKPRNWRVTEPFKRVTMGYQVGIGYTHKRTSLQFKYRSGFNPLGMVIKTSDKDIDLSYEKNGIQAVIAYKISKN